MQMFLLVSIIKKLLPEDAYLFDKITDEVNNFQPAAILCDFIKDPADSSPKVYAITENDDILSYAVMDSSHIFYNNRIISEPIIYTVERFRNKKIAQILLSNIIFENYRNHYITYGCDYNNTPSNLLAQKTGLKFLGTNYHYMGN